MCKVELGNSYFKVIGERVGTRGALKPPNFPFVFAFIFSLDIRDVSGLGKKKAINVAPRLCEPIIKQSV